MAPTVGIVIPAYRPNVGQVTQYIEALRTALDPATIRVELDAAPKAVEERLREHATVHVSPTRRGKGAAITAGFDALETDILTFLDADGSTNSESARNIIEPVLDDAVDLSVGSRRHPEAHVRDSQSVLRASLGDGFSWVARTLLGVSLTDFQCGAKAMHRESWRAVAPYLEEEGFGWDVELIATADALDLTIREIPITWEDAPESTVSTVGTTVDLARALVSARMKAAAIESESQTSRETISSGGDWSE